MGELLNALSTLNDMPPSTQGGELFKAISDLRQSDATGNMLQAQGANPDAAARAKSVADELGVAQPAVEADLPNFEQQLQIRKNREITAQNTTLQRFAADNPLAVRMAQDDFQNLDTVSKLTQSLSGGNTRALLEDELGWINTRKMTQTPAAGDAQREAEIQQQLQGLPQLPGGWGYLQKATSFARGLEKSAERATTFGVVGGAAGAAAGGVGAIPGFLGGFTTGIAADFARSSAANTYASLDKVRDNTGQPLSEPAKYLGAGIAGAITYFVGKAGGEQVSSTTMAGVDALVNRTLVEAATRPTVARAFGQLATTIGGSAMRGSAINSMMTIANTAGEQAARFITPNISTILTDPAQQAQFKESLINSIVEGAELFPLMELPGAGMRFVGDSLRARQAGIDAQGLSDLAAGVGGSKTRNRSMDTFINFMKGETQGSPVENFGIDGAALMTLYQKAGVPDPLRLDPQDDPLLGWLPDRNQQLREAVARKGDVIVPSADFVSRLGGTEAFNELLQDVRVRPDGMTLREAQDVPGMLARTREFMEAAQRLSDNFAKGQAEDEPMQKVYNDIHPQAMKAGYEPRVAEAYARTMAAHAAATAEREPGIYKDAWEAHQAAQLRIQPAAEGGAEGALGQRTPKGWGEIPGGIEGQAARKTAASLQLPPGGFGTGPHIMNIFAQKNRSSFLHEAGHLFLEQLIHDAQHPEGSEGSKADLQVLKDLWVSRAPDMLEHFMRMKSDAEAAHQAKPDDMPARMRAVTYAKAAELLGGTPESAREYMENFGETMGKSIEDPAVRAALMTPLHELFARTFEGYLMEGKAPSPGLQRVFDSFRTWLKSVYERIAGRGRAMLGLSQVAGTPIEVSPEVRGVMDRMLATDEQIEIMRQHQRLGRLFDSAEKAGMTSAEWKQYNDLVAKGVADARAKVQAKAMAQLEKEKSEEWEKKGDELRPGIEEQVNSRPDLRTLNYLRTGKMLGAEEQPENPAKVYLNQKALEALIGKDGLKNLPYGIYRKEGGLDPQELGEMFGYFSGSRMVDDLLSLEAQRRDLAARGINTDLRTHLIEEALKTALQDHFGDMTTDGTMPREAMDAVHNDASAQALAMELRALVRQSGMTRPVSGAGADARGLAEGIISGRPVAEATDLNRYARDERRAATAAEQAMLRGDVQEAIAQKRAQILNHALYREAQKAADSLEGLEDRARLYASKQTIKSMDQNALDQIHTLLERFGLKRPDQGTERREILSTWIDRLRNMGADVKVPDSLFNPQLPAFYRDLTVAQIKDLSDAIKSIAHVGREAQKITVEGKRADFAATVQDLARAAFTNVKIREIPLERNPLAVQGDLGERTRARGRNLQDRLAGIDSSLAQLEHRFIDKLDGKDSNGPWNRVIFRRIKEGRAYENKWREEMTRGIKELVKIYPKEEQDRLTQYLPELKELPDNETGQPTRITKGELVSIALNWGNDSNRSKMVRGEGWRSEAVQAVLDRHMTKADWDFTQGIWDLIEKLRPEISARERRMTGVDPVWIDARPVDTPHGEYRGGYYPMMYDPARSGDVMERLLENAQRMMDQSGAGRPATDRGYTMTRAAGYARPLMLSLDTLPRHIDTVVRDLAWRETIYDLTRIFRDPSIRDAVVHTAGQNMYDQVIPWLKRTIGDRAFDQTGNDFWASMAKRVRLNTTILGLGYRASTMILHGATALSNSIGEIGVKWMATGIKGFLGTGAKMAEMRDFIFAKSEDMEHRMRTFDRDIRDGLRELENKQGFIPGFRRYAYYGIAMLDMASAMPTWLGAYEKAMASKGEGGLEMAEKDAVYYADKSVRRAHGGGNPEDLAAFQHGNEFQKLAGMFYTFWSHFYNRQVDIAQSGIEAVRKGSAPDFAAVLARSWWYFVVPMIFHGFIKGGAPEEDEGWIGWAAKEVGLGVFSGIPVIRDIASALSTGREYKSTPALALYDALKRTGTDLGKLYQGEDASPHFLRHSLETAGYVFGLPIGQPAQSVQYLWDVWNGEQRPEDLEEFCRDMVMGVKRKK